MMAKEWFNIAQALVMGAAAFLTWLSYSSFRAGAAGTALMARMSQLEARMAEAGKKMSDLASETQGMLERNRSIFLTREEASLFMKQSSDDRLQMRQDIRDIRDALRHEPHARTQKSDS